MARFRSIDAWRRQVVDAPSKVQMNANSHRRIARARSWTLLVVASFAGLANGQRGNGETLEGSRQPVNPPTPVIDAPAAAPILFGGDAPVQSGDAREPPPSGGEVDFTRPFDAPGLTPSPRSDPYDLGGGFGGERGGGGPGYLVSWAPSRPVVGQNASLEWIRQSVNVGAPLWRDGVDTLRFNVGVRESHILTDAVLPDSRRPFPADLWNIHFGLSYSHRFDNGWTGTMSTSVGSASDRPFEGTRVMNVGLGGSLRIPVVDGRDFWMLGVHYNPADALNFPIPSVAYNWNPSSDFHMSIGLPSSLMWRPVENLTLNLSYAPLTNINAMLSYRFAEGLRWYGGYQFLNESFFLSDRIEERDRFFGFEQRVVTGIRWEFQPRAEVDLSSGYVFNRRFGEGVNQGATLNDSIYISPGAFVGCRFVWRF
jgi:hypothetical protein